MGVIRMWAEVVEPHLGLRHVVVGQTDRRINRDYQVPPQARLLRELARNTWIVFEPYKRCLPNPGRHVARLPLSQRRSGTWPPRHRDWDKPEGGQPDPRCDPGIRPVLPVTRPYQLGAGGLGQLSEHLAVRWVQQQPMGHAMGEDPVPAIPPGVSAGRVEDAVDIYQDQRRGRLHASTVRARQATCSREPIEFRQGPGVRGRTGPMTRSGYFLILFPWFEFGGLRLPKVLCSRVPLYQAMYSTIALRAMSRTGQARLPGR